MAKAVPAGGRYPRQAQDSNEATRGVPFVVVLAIVGATASLALGPPAHILIALVLCGLVVSEPRIGLYATIVSVALDTVSYDPWTEGFVGLYRAVPGFPATPIELLLVWTFVVWSARDFAVGDRRLPDKTTLLGVGTLTSLILLAIANGLNRGGDFVTALWEARGMLAILPMTLLTCGLLKDRRHVYEFSGVIVGALALMTLELGWRYFDVIRPGELQGALEQAFNHDGAMLVAALCGFAAAFIVWPVNRQAGFGAAIILLLALLVVMVSRRNNFIYGCNRMTTT